MSEKPIKETSYPDMVHKFETYAAKLSASQPALMETFWKLHKNVVGDGALDTKMKELMALAISVAARCDGCIAHHVRDALKAGATKEELTDTLGVAVLTRAVVFLRHVPPSGRSKWYHAGVGHSGQIGDVALPRGEIVQPEVA